jgi:hypothetical protein
VRPGGPNRSNEPAISQAAISTKPGFRNSDGCRLKKPSEYQRTAPLPKSVPSQGSAIVAATVPSQGSAIVAANAPANSTTPSRRSMATGNIEIMPIRPSAIVTNTAWRTT